MLPALVACEKINIDDVKKKLDKTAQDSDSKPSSEGNEDGGTTPDDGTSPDDGTPSGDKTPSDANDPSSYFHDAKDHLVVFKDDTSSPDEVHLTLLSLKEWEGVYSANYSEGKDMAINIASAYKEGTLTGWRIPTQNEAKQLIELYKSTPPYFSEALNSINSKLKILGGDGLHVWEIRDQYPAWRYLCDDGKYSFSLKEGSNITSCVKTSSTTYHLRLVRDSIQKK